MKRLLITFILSIGLLNPIAQSANAGDGVLFIAEDHLDGYDRTLFKLLIDADKNGCDTRAEVLMLYSSSVFTERTTTCRGGYTITCNTRSSNIFERDSADVKLEQM